MTSIDVAKFFLTKAQEKEMELNASLLQVLLLASTGLFSDDFIPFFLEASRKACFDLDTSLSELKWVLSEELQVELGVLSSKEVLELSVDTPHEKLGKIWEVFLEKGLSFIPQ